MIVKATKRKKLRLVFDSIKAEAIDEGHGAFEQMMDQIGHFAVSTVAIIMML